MYVILDRSERQHLAVLPARLLLEHPPDEDFAQRINGRQSMLCSPDQMDVQTAPCARHGDHILTLRGAGGGESRRATKGRPPAAGGRPDEEPGPEERLCAMRQGCRAER